jgi:lysophospholipase L1-like esterase
MQPVNGATPLDREVSAIVERDRRDAPPAGALVLAGSSSFRLWTNAQAAFLGVRVLNRGFGGSTMRDLLRNFDPLVASVRPAAVIVYEGDNDLAAGRSVDEIESDYEKFLALADLKLPGTPVVLAAVKPSPLRRGLMGRQAELNRRLRSMATIRTNVAFADTFTPLLNVQGEPEPVCFRADRLHLNSLGYARWAEVLPKEVLRLLSR